MHRSPHTWRIVLLALALRLLVLWVVATHYPHSWLYGRGIELGMLAQSLATGRGLSSPFGGATGPTALLAPGYPLLIAGLFRVLGPCSFPAAIAAMLMQLCFSLCTVLLIVRMTSHLFGTPAANLAGFFSAVSLPLIWMPTIFWETCLSTLLITGMVALALRPSLVPAALSGAYAGLAGLVNPALLLPLLAIAGWPAWRERRRRPGYLPLALLTCCIVYAPWPLRNARMLHAFVPLRSTMGLELWMGNHAGGNGYLDEAHFPLFNQDEYKRYVALGEVAFMREKATMAKAYIRAHPLTFFHLSALRIWRFWAGTGNRDGSILFAMHAVLTTVLGFAGLGRLFFTRRRPLAVLFGLPLLLFPLPYYITHAEFRYRLVIDPLLTVLAAHCAERT